MMLAKCIDDSPSKRTCNKNERTNILSLEPHVQLTSLPDEDQRCGVRNVAYVWMASMKTKVVSCNKICNFSWSLNYFNKVIGFVSLEMDT